MGTGESFDMSSDEGSSARLGSYTEFLGLHRLTDDHEAIAQYGAAMLRQAKDDARTYGITVEELHRLPTPIPAELLERASESSDPIATVA